MCTEDSIVKPSYALLAQELLACNADTSGIADSTGYEWKDDFPKMTATTATIAMEFRGLVEEDNREPGKLEIESAVIRHRLFARSIRRSQIPDVICRSFNFRPYGAPYGPERDNCELSDRDSRDMDMGNPDYYDTSSDYDFYERNNGRQGADGECLDGKRRVRLGAQKAEPGDSRSALEDQKAR